MHFIDLLVFKTLINIILLRQVRAYNFKRKAEVQCILMLK